MKSARESKSRADGMPMYCDVRVRSVHATLFGGGVRYVRIRVHVADYN